MLFKLFDACVKPILLYGSELCSVFNLNLSKKLSCEDENTLEKTFEFFFFSEKVHTSFCKYILWINKYASNIASKLNYVVFLLRFFSFIHSVKYWLYLSENPFETATGFSYFSLIYNDGDTYGSLNHNIGCLLKYLGFNSV